MNNSFAELSWKRAFTYSSLPYKSTTDHGEKKGKEAGERKGKKKIEAGEKKLTDVTTSMKK